MSKIAPNRPFPGLPAVGFTHVCSVYNDTDAESFPFRKLPPDGKLENLPPGLFDWLTQVPYIFPVRAEKK